MRPCIYYFVSVQKVKFAFNIEEKIVLSFGAESFPCLTTYQMRRLGMNEYVSLLNTDLGRDETLSRQKCFACYISFVTRRTSKAKTYQR